MADTYMYIYLIYIYILYESGLGGITLSRNILRDSVIQPKPDSYISIYI